MLDRALMCALFLSEKPGVPSTTCHIILQAKVLFPTGTVGRPQCNRPHGRRAAVGGRAPDVRPWGTQRRLCHVGSTDGTAVVVPLRGQNIRGITEVFRTPRTRV